MSPSSRFFAFASLPKRSIEPLDGVAAFAAHQRQAVKLPLPASFDPNQIGSATVSDNGDTMGSNIVFKCPRTGMNVQHALDEKTTAGPSDSTYEAVVCKACTGLHFINRANGKLLGQE